MTDKTTTEPIAEWLLAYSRWLPAALMDREPTINDAFRAGYLARVQDEKEHP